eukprot:Opistho-2@73515
MSKHPVYRIMVVGDASLRKRLVLTYLNIDDVSNVSMHSFKKQANIANTVSIIEVVPFEGDDPLDFSAYTQTIRTADGIIVACGCDTPKWIDTAGLLKQRILTVLDGATVSLVFAGDLNSSGSNSNTAESEVSEHVGARFFDVNDCDVTVVDRCFYSAAHAPKSETHVSRDDASSAAAPTPPRPSKPTHMRSRSEMPKVSPDIASMYATVNKRPRVGEEKARSVELTAAEARQALDAEEASLSTATATPHVHAPPQSPSAVLVAVSGAAVSSAPVSPSLAAAPALPPKRQNTAEFSVGAPPSLPPKAGSRVSLFGPAQTSSPATSPAPAGHVAGHVEAPAAAAHGSAPSSPVVVRGRTSDAGSVNATSTAVAEQLVSEAKGDGLAALQKKMKMLLGHDVAELNAEQLKSLLALQEAAVARTRIALEERLKKTASDA